MSGRHRGPDLYELRAKRLVDPHNMTNDERLLLDKLEAQHYLRRHRRIEEAIHVPSPR